jgi:hypothetical protein
MIKLNAEARKQLIETYTQSNIFVEGNILKIIDHGDDPDFKDYLDKAIEHDKLTRKKRLEVTKQIQSQNKELVASQENNSKLMGELKEALQMAESAKKDAVEDLDLLQKKTQTELIGTIVKVALYVIIGVGVTTTVMYMLAILTERDTQIIGSTWANMFGILLTNAFSIVGTIMGVKYASEKK